jgi:hypothetical protein
MGDCVNMLYRMVARVFFALIPPELACYGR